MRRENEEIVASADRLLRHLVEAPVLERHRDAARDVFSEREVLAVVVAARAEEGERTEGLPRDGERDAENRADAELAEERAVGLAGPETFELAAADVGDEQGLSFANHVCRHGGIARLRHDVDEVELVGVGVRKRDALEPVLTTERPDERKVRELGHDDIDAAARDLTRIQRLHDDAHRVVEKRRAVRRRLGERVGSRGERIPDHLAHARREVLIARGPSPLRPHVLVAENAGEPTVHPDGDVERRRDAACSQYSRRPRVRGSARTSSTLMRRSWRSASKYAG